MNNYMPAHQQVAQDQQHRVRVESDGDSVNGGARLRPNQGQALSKAEAVAAETEEKPKFISSSGLHVLGQDDTRLPNHLDERGGSMNSQYQDVEGRSKESKRPRRSTA
jgi:hypothetical protein